MISYHNDKKIKDKYIKRVKAHRLADELIQGGTGAGGKGCAVWCTLDKYDHKAYETELGIPQWLARVEDKIFEGLSEEEAQKWPEQFLKAVPLGKDLDKIKIPFLIFVVESALERIDQKKYKKQADAINGVLKELKKKTLDFDKLRAARSAAAYAAAYAAYAAYAAAAYAAAYAAYAAYAADADAAAYAADADAAAYAAAYAADAAAYAADAADADADAARRNEYRKFADKILELLRALK